MKKMLRSLALFTAAILLVSAVGCAKQPTVSDPGTPATPGSPAAASPATPATPAAPVSNTVLVVGVDGSFSEKWNPFLVESAYDHQVVDQIFTPIQSLNVDNELEDYGGTCRAVVQPDNTVLYTITVNEGMRFSDGTPVTINDYIYGLYVRADPSYTGPGTLLGTDIEGISEYYYDNPNYSADIARIESEGEKYAPENITFADWLIFAQSTDLEGEWSGDPGDLPDYVEYLQSEGYEEQLSSIDTENIDAVFEVFARCEYDNYAPYYGVQGWFVNKAKSDYALGNLSGGINVPEISGIKKVNEYTCTIHYTKINIYGDRDLADRNGAGNIVPKHYYGDFEKGNVKDILSNMEPMGSGPYIWGGFADNIVTCTANPDFFLGVPKTGTVRWQYIPQSDIVQSLASGNIDIANPSTSQANITEMDSLGLTYVMIDNAGYGYMGMNCVTLDQNVRKGLWSLMNRKPAVEAYYGDRAQVIQRPMTTVVAEYPQSATEYYPYSTEKALAFFNAAGYTQQGGKLVSASGEQLSVTAYIGGDGVGDHPAYPMLVQAANDLAALGGEIQIQDVPFAVLSAAVDDYTADMWIMAWSEVNTCDKREQFRSTGGQNNYQFVDAKMDAILDQIVQTIDLGERRALVSEMLDMAMDQCIEMPIYQRKNLLAYNPETLNMDTIPDATAFYDYENVLWQVEVRD